LRRVFVTEPAKVPDEIKTRVRLLKDREDGGGPREH